MSLSITKADFNIFLKQFKKIASDINGLSTIDMTGVLSDTYYSDPYDNGDPKVTIPLISACYSCDVATFTYQLSTFKAKLLAVFNAFEDYFLNYYGDSEVSSINDFMLKEGLYLTEAENEYYFSITGKRLYAGNVYKYSAGTYYTGIKHFSSTFTTGTWVNAYPNVSYSGTYNITNVTGTMTAPQYMAARVDGLGSTKKALVKFTYETTGDDLVVIEYFANSTASNNKLTSVPVLKVKSAEIIPTEDTRNQDFTDVVINVYYGFMTDPALVTINQITDTTHTGGIVTEPNTDLIYTTDTNFYINRLAVPNAGYEFTKWTDNELINPRAVNYALAISGYLVPVFKKLTMVNLVYTLDGSAYTGTSFSSNIVSGNYYKLTINPLFVFDQSLYGIDTISYVCTGGSGTLTNGQSLTLDDTKGAYTITIAMKSVAQISFTTNPAESTLTKYVVEFSPYSYSASNAPTTFIGDVVNIKARLIPDSPTNIVVFKKWTGNSDYKAILSKTLTASNSYIAEVTKFTGTPATKTITFTKTGTATCKDLTNLNGSNLPTSLVDTVAYSVYNGSSLSLELVATGTSAVWTITPAGGSPQVITTLTHQLDISTIAVNYTINCVVTA